MTGDDHLYLDRFQLAARGWTRALIERFLAEPDRWVAVDHWLNYTGKPTWFVEKVMIAEQLSEFKSAFGASVFRRRLSQAAVEAAMQQRERVDAQYRDWIRNLSPEDVKTRIVIETAAAALESARAKGYRTPNK